MAFTNPLLPPIFGSTSLSPIFGSTSLSPIFGNSIPTSKRTLLLSLEGQEIIVYTPFDDIRGTLSSVQLDYIVMIQSDQTSTLVQISKIERIQEL